MYTRIISFLIAGFALLSCSRLGLVAWQHRRVGAVRGFVPLLVGGLRIDAMLIGQTSALACEG